MKVLLVNTYATGGGAAIAARRMLEGLLAEGIDARMLVAGTPPKGVPDEVGGVSSLRHRIAFIAERLGLFHSLKYNPTNLFRVSSASRGIDITDHPWVQAADVIHLHWVQQGFLSLRGLQKLLSLPSKRFFWSLHDLWPLTGGCHIPYLIENGETNFCLKFQRHCGACPILSSHRPLDAAFRQHERKSQLPLEKVHFLGVSEAVVRLAKATPLLKGAEVSLLPNFISPTDFYPDPSVPGPTERRILFVAARLDDPVKGLDLCEEVLHKAARLSSHFEREAHFIMVGKMKNADAFSPPVKATYYSNPSASTLRELYQTASLTLSTSRFETFGQTLLESIACGTPALAFNVGGISDIITPEAGNGALVSPYDTRAMAEQLVMMTELHRPPDREQLSNSVDHFYTDRVTKDLIHKYEGSRLFS